MIHFRILQELQMLPFTSHSKWGLNVSHVPPVFLVFFSHPCILCLSCFLCILRVSFPFFLSHLPSTSTISILRYLIISMQKLWNWAKKAKSGRTWQIWPKCYFKIMAPLGSFQTVLSEPFLQYYITFWYLPYVYLPVRPRRNLLAVGAGQALLVVEAGLASHHVHQEDLGSAPACMVQWMSVSIIRWMVGSQHCACLHMTMMIPKCWEQELCERSVLR